jgi:hypothetical protein
MAGWLWISKLHNDGSDKRAWWAVLVLNHSTSLPRQPILYCNISTRIDVCMYLFPIWGDYSVFVSTMLVLINNCTWAVASNTQIVANQYKELTCQVPEYCTIVQNSFARDYVITASVNTQARTFVWAGVLPVHSNWCKLQTNNTRHSTTTLLTCKVLEYCTMVLHSLLQ